MARSVDDCSGIALNHCPPAMDSLRVQAEAAKSRGLLLEAAAFLWVHDLIARAQKFILPDGGRLIHMDHSRVGRDVPMDLIRLPYPVTAIEYRQNAPGTVGPLAADSRRRIAVALDLEQAAPPWLARSVPRGGGIGVLSVFTVDGPPEIAAQAQAFAGGWRMVPGMVMIPYDQSGPPSRNLTPLLREAFVNARGHVPQQPIAGYGIVTVGILPSVTLELLRYHGHMDKVTAALIADIDDELGATVDLCVALNCDNIVAEDVLAPAALNRKRARSGKPPLCDYKVLVVRPGPQRGSSGAGQGTRMSPRQHFRRGHIRRLGDHRARFVWVSPSVVGSQHHGFLRKDYLMRKNARGSAAPEDPK